MRCKITLNFDSHPLKDYELSIEDTLDFPLNDTTKMKNYLKNMCDEIVEDFTKYYCR